MFSSVRVTDEHRDLFERANDLLARMDKVPSVLSVTAAFLGSRDRVKELEAEVAQLKRVH